MLFVKSNPKGAVNVFFGKIIRVDLLVWYLIASVVQMCCRFVQIPGHLICWQWLQLLQSVGWLSVVLSCRTKVGFGIRILPHGTSTSNRHLQMVVWLVPPLIV